MVGRRVERLAYGHSIEALLAAVQPVLDAGLVAELRDLGIDPKKVLPSYPAELTRKAVAVCAKRLSPTVSEDEALRALGRRFVERYGESLIGRALVTASKLLGPRRMLDRAATQFRTANNYLETKVMHFAPGRSELWLNEVAHGPWFEGIIAAMLEICGAHGVSVRLAKNDASGAVFSVSWQP